MKYKVFVDGQEGTTGLKINDYLSVRDDIEVLYIEEEKRKDPERRRVLLNEADVAILCLPDVAAKESVSLVTNPDTCIIDASTAHRVAPGWAYGFPELNRNQREVIKNSKRIAVPGCHATGFVSLIYPLINEGIVSKNYPVTCLSLTGYSGGGKKLIQQFENGAVNNPNSPKPYALTLNHKHLPEMQKIAGLDYPPIFTPVVANYYKGMAVSVPLLSRLLNKLKSAADVHEFLSEYYSGEKFIKVMPLGEETNLENGFLNAESCNDTNRLEIFVFGHDDQVLLTARLDNLGKGASGAAIQNLNIVLGADEGKGLMA